jgi:hypothetical protein
MEKSYKEKYQQALAKAKEQSNYPCMRSCMGILEEIFPELAESGDEKIRKRLITDFGTIGKKEWGGLEVKDILAWLERQGEHAYFLSKIQVGDKVTRNEAGVLVNLSQLNRVAKPEENKGNICGISPNSVWSEEDEINVYNIIHFLEEPSMLENNEPCKKIVIDWLKSFQDRVQPQPKQEWSEEDKYMYDILCGTIENTDINENTKYKLISWLKSIKGRVGCEANCTTTKE